MTYVRTKNRTRLSALVSAIVLVSATMIGYNSSSALAVELDFNVSAPTSGTISYGGTGGGLVGTNIEVDSVVGLTTPANANVTSLCLSCVLNFTSGLETSAGGPNSNNNGWWSFGSGGSISITGGVQLQGGTDIPLGSTLLSGTFSSAFVQDLGVNGFKVTFGSFTDTKNPDLLSYYGLTPGTTFQGALTLLFASANPGPGGAFTSSSVFSGNIVNGVVPVNPVPLPAAAWLFGTGLLGMFPAVRRRFVY